jgi:inhibitor of KinA sporulation pathway (predicted exonuclease)
VSINKLLDKTIVIDLEATCWDKQTPKGQESEIIEIGVCLLDNKTYKRTDKRGMLIVPTRSKLSKFCTGLTTITQHEADDGMSLEKAFHILRQDYQSLKRPWVSWGYFDKSFLELQAKEFALEYPMSTEYINLKNLFAIKTGLRKEIGLAKAMKKLGLTMEGQQHRGKDDAWNTAAILQYVLT